MKFYVLIFSLFAAIGLTSCGGSCDATTYSEEVSEQSTAVTAAANAYFADTTDSTLCMDYVAELEAQIDIYEKYQDCDELNVAGAIDAAITSTQTQIDALDCN